MFVESMRYIFVKGSGMLIPLYTSRQLKFRALDKAFLWLLSVRCHKGVMLLGDRHELSKAIQRNSSVTAQ